MKDTKFKTEKRTRRHARVRSQLHGTETKPRLSVFRSNRFIYGQLINDDQQVTLTAVTDKGIKGDTKRDRAFAAGKQLAEAAVKKGITTVAFDRGGFLYKGRVQAFADGAREGGLQF